MKEKVNRTDVGVIVGRFMVHELHAAHKDLIQSVIDRHDKVLIFLGLSPLRNTFNNPLDYRCRKQMIQEVYPDVEVFYVEDNRSDEVWSKTLDTQISKWTTPHQTATLYGSRDSFIKHYHGKFPVCELEAELFISGTEVRKKIINSYPPTKDFRAGIIAATGMRFPTSYQAVDVAIIDQKKDQMLMAKKPNETLWRFVGGFSDPRSDSLEEDVRREVMEEAGVEIDQIMYVTSAKVQDWRYRSEIDCIKSAFFIAHYVYGRPTAGDDVSEVGWLPIDLEEGRVVEEHRGFLKRLKEVKPFANLLIKNTTKK